MNKLILILGILALIPAASALIEITGTTIYGGDTVLIHSFDDCVNLTVSVMGTLHIDPNEYWLHDCTETEPNLWSCHCDCGSFDLLMTTQVNTINNYTFHITYLTEQEVVPRTVVSGGRTFYQRDIVYEVYEEPVVEPEEPIVPPEPDVPSEHIRVNVTDEVQISEDSVFEEEVEGKINLRWLIAVLMIFITLIFVNAWFRRKKQVVKSGTDTKEKEESQV